MLTWAENIGWGAGSTFQTAASAGLMRYGLEDEEYLKLRGILEACTQAMRKIHSFDLTEYLGGQGPQGPPGPRGLPGLPGIGTDYVPVDNIPSDVGPPSNFPRYDSDVPDTSYTNIATLWSQVATVGVWGQTLTRLRGWAKFTNDNGGSRTLYLWMVYRKYGEAVDGNPTAGDPDIYRVSDTVSMTIGNGETKLLRVTGVFTPTYFGYVDLFASIDSYVGSEVRAEANEYGISGRGFYRP